MNEYFFRESREVIEHRGVTFEIVENPERAFTVGEKEEVVSAGEYILKRTTGKECQVSMDVRKFMLGVIDRGRVLCLMKDGDKYVGFVSFHLLNQDGRFIRYHGRTIMHAGSGHVLPDYQGKFLWLKAAYFYGIKLPEDLRPAYVEGFTQSPRLLRLISLQMRGRIYPNVDGSNIDNLRDCQAEILPIITRSMGNKCTVRNECVVNLGERVYPGRVSAGIEFDSFFYDRLGVNPENGDFVHFIATIPYDLTVV